MSVSVVNGFLCYSSCDVAKARAGKDPHPKPQQPASEEQSQGASPQGVSSADPQAAVTFGGTLATLNAITPVDAGLPAASANLQAQSTIDILV